MFFKYIKDKRIRVDVDAALFWHFKCPYRTRYRESRRIIFPKLQLLITRNVHGQYRTLLNLSYTSVNAFYFISLLLPAKRPRVNARTLKSIALFYRKSDRTPKSERVRDAGRAQVRMCERPYTCVTYD